MKMENFIASLGVMGWGMLGIFVVTIVLILIIKLLTRFLPGKKNGEGEGTVQTKE